METRSPGSLLDSLAAVGAMSGARKSMKTSPFPAITCVALLPALALGSASATAATWPQGDGVQLDEHLALQAEAPRVLRRKIPAGTTPLVREPMAPMTGVMAPVLEPRESPDLAGNAQVELPNGEAVLANFRIDRERLYVIENEDATWVRGATYKARIDEDGFKYIPFLGSAAPRSYPVEFRLASAAMGSRVLDLDERAALTRQGDRFVLDRGPVEVIYDFEPRQVEQSFSVDPSGFDGDLVLTLEVTTDLAPAPEGAGFRFDGPHGGIGYGAATVLDGAGRSAHVHATLEGSSLVLTVPAAFLSEAAGPVLVDPVIVSYGVEVHPRAQRRVDVTYDHGTDSFLYVFEDNAISTDTDIYFVLTSAVGGQILADNFVEIGDGDWAAPSVASVNSTDTALIAVTRTSNGEEAVSVVGRLFNFSTRTLDPGVIQITQSSTTMDRKDPDVGGNSSATAGDKFLVVWEADYGTDSDIQWRTVDSSGSLGPLSSLESSVAQDSFFPAVSKSTGRAGTYSAWNVGFINAERATHVYSLQAARIDPAGNMINPATNILTLPSGKSIGELDVSDGILPPNASEPYFAMVHDQYATAEEDTFVTFVRSGAAAPYRVYDIELQRQEHADLAPDQGGAAVATTASEFVFAYLETVGAAVTSYVTSIDITEDQYPAISERRTNLGSVGINGFVSLANRGPRMASRFSGGSFNSRYVAVARETGDYDEPNIGSSIFYASHPYSPAFQYCYGTPNSTGDRGFIRMEGNRSATAAKRLVASALPPSAFGFFIVGNSINSGGTPFSSGGSLCILGTIGRSPLLMSSGGTPGVISHRFDPTAIPRPSGAVTGMAGQRWYFQFRYFESIGGVLTPNYTNACSLLLN